MKRKRPAVKPVPKTPDTERSSTWMLVFVLAYTAAVLALDTFAVHNVFVKGADLFKIVAWFAIPFLFSLRRFDWGWLGVARWKRIDIVILGALVLICAGAVLVIPLFPSLRTTYGSVSHFSAAAKRSFVTHRVIWTFSWLIGWEFLHRCVLLRQLSARWPRWGWLIIPVFEGAYHLQKPMIEALGMVAFSAILTPWALRRRNVLLPFLAHLAIELELIAFLVLM